MNRNNLKILVENVVTEVLRKGNLFHTTNWKSLEGILRSGVLRPDAFDKFVSFAPAPFFGDISGNDVTLEVQPPANVMPVEYTKRWFNKYREHASYVAGEGWYDQFVVPEECYDEEFKEYNEECEAQAWLEAEFTAFIVKREEKEWISTEPGEDVPIIIRTIWVKDASGAEVVRRLSGTEYPIRKLDEHV